jgi:hypothetical protein
MAPPVPGRGNIHVAEGLGVPVLITVPGPVIDDVGITRLTADPCLSNSSETQGAHGISVINQGETGLLRS